MNYKEFNDYELISHIRDNIEEANEILFEKYKPLIENNARKLLKTSKKNGIEFYDLVQEGMVGLNNALNTFDENKEASFYTYAKKCIERKQLSYVIGSERKKHKLLNESISYNINENDDINDMPKILIDNSQNPENMMLDTENSNELTNKIKSLLTPFEREVFELKINGFTYIEISEKLHKDKKAIDNAIQRIKTKIKDNLDY
ncbi:MAG: sigma-70 family RNA polymerase sigma factor [Bacilli bacterium]|jgi:RNA polymerase sporulation-specific sigma factor|nr:sigma-70 family RNA polymerase sigma factor [Bacilli bacterium]